MTVRLGPPYVDELSVKVRSPAWHRLRGASWLAANVLFTGLAAFVLIVDAPAPWTLIVGLVALGAAAACLIASILDVARYSKPVAPVINLVVTLLINPYMVAGYLVGFGVLDFG